jgi:peptide/nickel transport system permease protein
MNDGLGGGLAGAAVVPADAVPAARRRLRSARPVVWLCFGWLALILFVAITVRWLHLPSYITAVGRPNQSPGLTGEFLGTDAIGRSMISRLAYGAQISILISFAATAIAMVGGGLVGLLSVYFRGVFNAIVEIVVSSILTIPSLLFLLTIVVALRPTLVTLIVALGVSYLPIFVRLTRARAQSEMTREYVVAARAMGASPRRIIGSELLPNTAPALLSYAVLVLPGVMITEGSLSFLGFGVQPPAASWGNQIALADQTLTTSPWQAIIPCLLLTMTVFALNTAGDDVRARLDVRGAE